MLLLLAALTTQALAADGNQAAYENAIAVALDRYRARDWGGARAAFEQAHALEPSARTSRGLALCAYYAGDYVAAATEFQQALSESRRELSQEQRAQAEKLLEQVFQHIARVNIHAQPSGATIQVEQRPVKNDERVLLAPGHYHIEVSLPGHATHSEDFELTSGQQLSLRIELSVEPRPQATSHVEAPAPKTAATPAASVAPRAARDSIVPWIAAGTTLAFGVVAASFAISASHELHSLQDECRRQGCTAARRAALWADSPIGTYETVTNTALAATAAGAVTTAALFVFSRPTSGPHEPPLSVQASGLGLHLLGRF